MMLDLNQFVFLANVASTLMMVGLIWFVQVVHYPNFALVGSDFFREYQIAHMIRTTWVVVIPMVIEAATAAWLAWNPPRQEIGVACRVGFALVVAIWIITWFKLVPMHTALANGFDATFHGALLKWNWVRTAAWSARGILVLFALHQSLFLRTSP